jgi:lipopolysaccharide export system protein LptA
MKKSIAVLAGVVAILAGAELEITSQQFRFDPTKNISTFTGQVKAVQGKDYIYCHQLTIYLNKKRKPVKYVASGNVKFRITLDPQDIYTGSGQKLIYKIPTGEIVLEGNGTIVNQVTGNRVSGDLIQLNRFSKKAVVKSAGNKPVKMVIKVEE